jgi:hypothetical protein
MAPRRTLRIGLATLCGVAALAAGAQSASAAAPGIGAVWASAVQTTTVRLNAEVDPSGKSSTYHFDYILKSTYDANVAASKDGFTGASRLPSLADTIIGGTSPTTVSPTLPGLQPDTAYRYRVVVKNADGTTTGSARTVVTYGSSNFALLDGRGWEMVSPVEKNGGRVEVPGALAGGGVLQAAADGQSVSYGSGASFAGGAQGATVASQYVSSRGGGGWATANVTPPLLSGSYGTEEEGVPYQLFSPDLARGLMLNGRPCRGEATGCPVANPPLAGTDAPVGYQNFYLRQSAGGSFEALLGSGDVAGLDTDPADFELAFAGASPTLGAVVLSTCAALTANASEVTLGGGCDPAKQNLYLWSGGSLSLVNLLPAQSTGTPGAALGAQAGAVSAEGSRVYFNDAATGNLYLRAGGQTKQVDTAAGGGGTFQTASSNGAFAFYTKAGHLYRYDAVADSSVDLTLSGGVVGVIGASAAGDYVYYVDGAGLRMWHNGSTKAVAAAADSSNYPPSAGTARVSADGTKLLFLSATPLETSDGTTYDNLDAGTKAPDRQVYLYDAAGAGTLSCVSCNPTRARPLGPSSIPGAVANGTVPGSTQLYKPRVLMAGGGRIFFDSRDALVLSDVNLAPDVYEWEAQGVGSCTRVGGCVALVSSGLAGTSSFVDASLDGADAFFITDRSLVGVDPGAADLYDARIGGGFPEPTEPSPCVGDACQVVPAAPEDPVLTTVLPGPGNPSERYHEYGLKVKKCPKGKVRRGKRCVRKAHAKAKHHHGRKR